MAINANANGIPFLKRYGIPPAIKNSMVLWYDIARQGATNENMAENPVLTDLSGNGHDITCYNFAWGGMSGIDGYPDNLRNYKITDYDGFVTKVVNDHKFTINGNIGVEPYYLVLINATDYSAKRGSLYAKGIPDGLSFIYQINGATPNPDGAIKIKNGLNEFNLNPNETSNFIKIQLKNTTGEIIENVNIEIEFLPLYPNALVSDGVDDIAESDIFNLGKDWTLMFDADFFSENNTLAGIAKNNRVYVYDYGGGNKICMLINETSKVTALIDKENAPYCILSDDKIYLKDGTIVTTESSQSTANLVSSSAFSIFGKSNDFSKMALRKVILFNRTLTDEEIEWVKTNLISISTNK